MWRAFRSRHTLSPLCIQTPPRRPDDILCFACVRNEALRLPYFLSHYRRLGVTHFFIVENDSTDNTAALLSAQPDVSLWSTKASYKSARFGQDWLNWLLLKYGRNRWCVTVDADEILVYSDDQTQNLQDVTRKLDQRGVRAMGALMLDLYPKGPIDRVTYAPGQNPLDVLPYFDPGPYRATRQSPKENLWVQGGLRERVFFPDTPEQGPTLNKLPLVKWHWRYVYANSTHAILPSALNHAYTGPGDKRFCGALLHTKFLPQVIENAKEDRHRKQHFGQADAFVGYYEAILKAPDLWSESSIAYSGSDQLVSLGLISRAPPAQTQGGTEKTP